jgi:hypothetical protein
MKHVWKFPLNEPHDIVSIEMPAGAIIRSFQTQRTFPPKPKGVPISKSEAKRIEILTSERTVEVPTIWAEVSLDSKGEARKEIRKFCIAGTGHELTRHIQHTEYLEYIGTTQLYNGDLVLHLYEVKTLIGGRNGW